MLRLLDILFEFFADFFDIVGSSENESDSSEETMFQSMYKDDLHYDDYHGDLTEEKY